MIVAGGVDNHIFALLKGVHDVKNKTGRYVKPFYIGIGTRARHYTKARSNIIVPFEGQATARDCQ